MAHLTPLAFLGAGSMAQALIRGLLGSGLALPADVRVTNRSDRARLEGLATRYGVLAFPDKDKALSGAGTIILATKAADARLCLEQARPFIGGRPLVISVAAGLPTAVIESLLPEGTPVVRAMPNTSSSVGESATAIAAGRWAAAEHLEVARQLFEVVGLVVELAESDLDAVTGLSGSGPAYVYLLLEAMAEAGASLGLDPNVSYRLALQTIRGAAATARLTGESPSELRRKVTSPGGTTMAGLAALERAGFKEGVIEAVRRAAARAAELGAEARG